ncbi:putative quinol monooxygenase [Furfurilactobacillus rossiae]|nr:antibiotic biosynthesis monooxygenase [Furfurilactobacillus rossiae]
MFYSRKDTIMQIINCEFHIKHDQELLTQFKKAALVEIDHARKDRGNISFSLFQDVENQYELQMIEAWDSESSIELHANSGHNQQFNRELSNLVTHLPAVHQYVSDEN